MPFPFGFQPDNEGQPYDLSDAELASHTGSVPMRAAVFEYMGRDGGDIEGLGAGIEAYSFNCFYTGEDYDARLRGLRNSIQRQPKGLLTHIELGGVRAHCLGIDEFTVDYVRERETVNFRISFKRDATEITNFVSQTPSVSSKAAQLYQTLQNAAVVVSIVNEAIFQTALFPTTVNVALQTVTSTFDALVNFAQIFASSAVQAATLGIVDFTIDAQRESVFLAGEHTTIALRATGLPDPTLYPSLSAVQSIYAQTLELDQLVRTQAPEIKTIVIQGRQPLVVFLAQQYGPGAIGKLEEARINNRVGSFGLVPGFTMRVIAPTVTPPRLG